MIDDFMIRALIAGIGIAIIAATLGCFVVWRRMAYFGDSLAHSALLGVALGLVTGMNANLGIIIVCTAFAMLLAWLEQKRVLAIDTLLGILAHAALSTGMVAISLLGNTGFDLHSYLFGDILAVSTHDLYAIGAAGVVVIGLLVKYWHSLTLMTIHEDLAKAEGVNTYLMQLILMGMMTLVVAVSIRVVGILLITSMLIIPAATARQLVRSPIAMALAAVGLGICAVIGGIYSSMHFDTPSGPSIVSVAAIIFALLLPISMFIQHRATASTKNL